MGQSLSCCQKQSFGMDSSKFERTYSPIFAPFLVNVAVRLLNNSGQRNLRLDDYIGGWGGGIKVIRKCCNKNKIDPNDKHANWDTLVNSCVNSTPIDHDIWIQLLKYNKIRVTTDTVINLENLLMHWVENGHKYRTYGPYPKAPEQEAYIQDTIPPRISEILNYAIISNVFEKSYNEMEKEKKGRIRRSISGKPNSPGHGVVGSGSIEMDEYSPPSSPRDDDTDLKTKSQAMDIRPVGKEATKIHICLWVGILVIAVLYTAVMILGTDQYMVMSWMSPDGNGYFQIDWGWRGYTVTDDSENQIVTIGGRPILAYSERILADIEPLLIFCFILTISFLLFIIFLLIMRKKEGKGYYFYCGRIKFPQRPLVYVLFEMINMLSVFLVSILTALLIYGCVELIPWSRRYCTADSCAAVVIPIPHVGYFLICAIPFIMSCWVYKYTAKLDYKLDYKTMRIYYPEHVSKLNRNRQGIYMYDLLDGMNALRKSMLLMLFAICFQNSGMLTIFTMDDTGSDSGGNGGVGEMSIWLQPHGLNNIDKYSQFDSASNWIQSGTAFNVFIPIFILFHFIILCYFIHVFLNYRVIKIIKWIFLFIITIEIIIWICLMLAYYFSFDTYWNDDGESHVSINYANEGPDSTANTIDNDNINIFWIPDYGFIVLIMILCYMCRLWWRIIRAM